MSPTKSGLKFGITVHPVASVKKVARKADCVMEVLHPHCLMEGWLLPTAEVDIRGIRALHHDKKISAKRKQLRPDIYRQHPDRPEALHCGFKIPLVLRAGWNHIQLQYKTIDGQWIDFGTCELRLPRFWRMRQLWARHIPQNAYERWLSSHDVLTPSMIHSMRDIVSKLPARPLISILMPTYNTPKPWLLRAIESIKAQIYPHWELCIADDASTLPHVRQLLLKAASSDHRIKVVFRNENGHICQASNSALELCTGSFTALMDNDDELSPDALFHLAEAMAKHPEVDLLFSDEDKIDEHGIRSDPYFKPGWNYELLLHQNCVCHLSVFRTSLFREVGGFRVGYEGSQDWDLILRVLQRIPHNHVRHIPRVLYHWRMLETSTAATIKAKPYAITAGMRAVQEHLNASGQNARVELSPDGPLHIDWALPEPPPLVSIIIPTRDRVDLLRVALDTLFMQTEYPRYEVVIVDHASEQEATQHYLDTLAEARSNVSVIRAEGAFNWSRLNNLGAAKASGEILLFLNNDVEITDARWLRKLAANANRPDIGAVGALLLYPNGTIQHAGVVLGINGIAGHVFRTAQVEQRIVGLMPTLPREVTAVTGACLAVRRSVFQEAGGFDDEYLPISYNDLDFCLRLRARGLRNLYVPDARLIHHESLTRAASEKESSRKAEASKEAQILMDRWPAEFAQDAFYSPRLARDTEWPSDI